VTAAGAGGEEDGGGDPIPMWEPVLDKLLTDEGADAMRAEVAAVLDQHSLLAGAFNKFGFEAGAYTRPLFSSTCAVSDTKYTLNTPKYPLTPPKHPLNNPGMHPLSHRKRSR
jgi:hypothetical protein